MPFFPKPYLLLLLAVAVLCCTGCQAFRSFSGLENQPIPTTEVANPLAVPMLDRWLVMEQISDELDDYFRIFREERIRMHDGIPVSYTHLTLPTKA